MLGTLVGAADIHAGAAADRLEDFENLDVLGGVIGPCLGPGLEQVVHSAHGIGLRGDGFGGHSILWRGFWKQPTYGIKMTVPDTSAGGDYGRASCRERVCKYV